MLPKNGCRIPLVQSWWNQSLFKVVSEVHQALHDFNMALIIINCNWIVFAYRLHRVAIPQRSAI